MSEEHLKLENQLCFRLYSVSREVTRLYAPMLKAVGLTYPQYLVMLVLWQHKKPCRVSEIGELLNLDSGTLSPLLKRLEGAEIVVRQRSEQDERTVFISLTEKGLALKQQVNNIPLSLMEKSPLTRDELAQLATLLDKVKGGLNCQ